MSKLNFVVTKVVINTSNEVVLILDATDDIGTKTYRINFTKWAEVSK